MNKYLVSFMVAVITLCFASCGKAGPVIVDNFDTGSKPNRMGGDFGSWDKDPNDQTQGCQISFDSTIKHGDSGYSLRLDYDVESPNPAYNGFWMKLNNFDGRRYKYLVMYVKGDTEKGFTTQYKVELKNKNEVGKYLVTGITDSWQKIKIPLNKFKGLTDMSSLTEFVVVFDDINSTERYGALNIDDVYFE